MYFSLCIAPPARGDNVTFFTLFLRSVSPAFKISLLVKISGFKTSFLPLVKAMRGAVRVIFGFYAYFAFFVQFLFLARILLGSVVYAGSTRRLGLCREFGQISAGIYQCNSERGRSHSDGESFENSVEFDQLCQTEM